MLDYEWGNPSTIMLTGNDDPAAAAAAAAAQDPDQTHRQIFDHYALLPDHIISHPHQVPPPSTATATTTDFSLHHFNPQTHNSHHHHNHHQQQQHIHHSLFDPRAFPGASSSYAAPPPPSMLSLDPLAVSVNPNCVPGLMVVPKSEDVGRSMDFPPSRIGLNLGGRTYFSSEDDFVNRLYRRPRPTDPGSTTSSNSPRCQAEGCNADLSHAKHYHRRHKVCEFHSKASTVMAAGLTQRFCQQCSRL